MACKYKYFTEERDPKMVGVDSETMAMADMGRKFAKTSFVLTSGVRTKEENDKLPDAVEDSAHLTGAAIDIYCADSTKRFAVVKALMDVGFTRIGIGPNFIHVDTDKSKPAEVFFTYRSSKGAPADWHLKGC